MITSSTHMQTQSILIINTNNFNYYSIINFLHAVLNIKQFFLLHYLSTSLLVSYYCIITEIILFSSDSLAVCSNLLQLSRRTIVVLLSNTLPTTRSSTRSLKKRKENGCCRRASRRSIRIKEEGNTKSCFNVFSIYRKQR